MARVTYESKDDAGHRFWVAHSGRYVIRVDANRPGVDRWLISLEGRSVRKGVASDRGQADAAVSDALDELPPSNRLAASLAVQPLPASNLCSVGYRHADVGRARLLQADRGAAGPVRGAARRRLGDRPRGGRQRRAYIRADGTKVWSLMQLERQLRPGAFGRRRGGYIDRRQRPAADT
jgi:hypothetical protein